MTKYGKGSIGYFLELAKKDGFDNLKDWNEWRKKTGKMPDPTKINKKYKEKWAKKVGYDNFAEYERKDNWKKGKSSPLSENEECSLYLGIHISERKFSKQILPIVLGNIEKEMPINNPGYDFIVGGIKVDCKSRALQYRGGNGLGFWIFDIAYNSNTDYFLLIGFDNRKDLNILRAWLIKKDAIVRKGIGGGYRMEKFYNRSGINITNEPKFLSGLKKYEITDKLKGLK